VYIVAIIKKQNNNTRDQQMKSHQRRTTMLVTMRARSRITATILAPLLLLTLSSSCTTATATSVITKNENDPLVMDEDIIIGTGSSNSSSSTNTNLRGIRPQQQHEDSLLLSQPQESSRQEVAPLGSDKPRLRKKKNQKALLGGNTNANHPLQTFAHNMLTNQGCPPSPTSNCGDICYVLTTDAASDLHSVAIGTSSQPTHHWHDPTTFWHVGVCNSKRQCISSVNPFDGDHNFDDLTNALSTVERECGRSVGMASMFVLAKAMEPPAWLKKK